jgi:hypothetical protein
MGVEQHLVREQLRGADLLMTVLTHLADHSAEQGEHAAHESADEDRPQGRATPRA